MVYTEPGPEMSVAAAGRVVSPPSRLLKNGAGAWVAICGSRVEPVGTVLPCWRMAVAGRTTTPDGAVIVYGSVLPWRGIVRQAPDLVEPGESYADAFVRLLAQQVADVQALMAEYSDHTVVWAGDFNQGREGPNYGGSAAGRVALAAALGNIGPAAWNTGSAHAKSGMCAIALICGPAGVVVSGVERIEPRALSDRAGCVVSFGDGAGPSRGANSGSGIANGG